VVTVPSWRATKDISQKEDLVEEVGRMIGYSSIRPVPPLVPSVAPQSNPVRGYLQQVREVATGRGFDEVYNYSFVSDELAREYGLDPGDHLRVENPIASDLNLMRRSLVPRIGENVNENRKHFDAFRLFEIGREIDPREGGLPEERLHLVAASYRKQDGEGLCLDEVKSLAEVLLPGFAVEPGGARAYEHPARAGAVRWRGEVVGRVFELHPRLVDTGRAALLEVDLELVRRLGAREVKYRAVRKVPATAFDLSVIVQARDLVGSLKGKLVELAGEELEKVEFLVDYALGDGTRSVSFRLTLAAPGRTMTAEEAATVRGRIVEGLKGAGYGFRG
jgi:phenylalanyl-tRNA synthetase beta chain